MDRRLYAVRPVSADDAELVHLRALERVLVEQNGIGPTIVAPDGGSVPVPRTLNRLLQEITHILANGDAVDVVSVPSELTIVEAAELLNESEAEVKELIQEGHLPVPSGSPARIPLPDVVAFRNQRDSERRQALEELIQLNQDLGFYAKR
ncbi:MAG TPA: helix-turn-helix domain-containing protein [Thermomicrobiales bacterium]|jgi:hypothetical protein